MQKKQPLRKLRAKKEQPAKLTRSQATKLAWERGLLSYKLYDYQYPLYYDLKAAIENPSCLKYVLNVSRRWGKSTILCLLAIEYALKNPNSQIRFAAPTAKALKKITNPIFKMLCEDAPLNLKPRYRIQDQMWVFANGSEIHMAGTDNQNYESLRGTTSNLNLIDEAGFASELDYVLRSVLLPQTLTTGGTTLIASTPPKSPAHDFYDIAMECQTEGYYKEYTIYDNTTLTPEIIELYAKESGGYDSTTWKREYLAQFVVDQDLQIVPEWDDMFIQEPLNDTYTHLYHRYVAMDLGVKDFTAVLFGYYDFRNARLYVEDELTINGPSMTTEVLQQQIKEKEAATFGNIKPYRRISDNNNLMLLQDLGSLHMLHFAPTNKEALEAMINDVRMLVGRGQLRVHPRCKMLIGCLKYGIWTEKRDKFARSSVYKHFDHLAALVYMIRNLDKQSNPIPTTYGVDENTHYVPQHKQQTNNTRVLQDLFGSRFSR